MSHPAITIPEELIAEVARTLQEFCSEIRNCEPRDVAIDLASGYKGAFNFVKPFLSFYSKPKILEIGSGNGFGLCYMLKSGLDVIGVEPGSEISFEGRYETALSLLEANSITPPESYLMPAYAEKLPFEDNTFDIVFSIAVLEHVRDVEASMREALRVVKPDGIVIMNVPNYNSFYEGHYNIMWLPYILNSKKVAKWYVRTLFRRHDYFIDELNLTTSKQLLNLKEKLTECSSLEIYYYCSSPLDKISAVHYYLSQGLITNNSLLESLRKYRFMNRALRSMAGFVSTLLGRLGLAPVFNVVCLKNQK
jgi:SAM-dependent methyltransferase